jgi:hypothetical protein
MQIIESTPFGLRSAIWTMSSKKMAPRIHIFPMIHLADKAFFDFVKVQALKCDLILTEGVKSKSAPIIASAYSFAGKSKRLNLSVQPKIISDKCLNIDISETEFDASFSAMTLKTRFLILTLAPLYGLCLKFFASRHYIATRQGIEIEKSRNEILEDSSDWDEAFELLVDKRDKIIIRNIRKILVEKRSDTDDIAIVYGAEHMRAILHYLINAEEYQVVSSQWVDVIKL